MYVAGLLNCVIVLEGRYTGYALYVQESVSATRTEVLYRLLRCCSRKNATLQCRVRQSGAAPCTARACM